LREWQNWESWDIRRKREYRKFAEQFIDECREIGCDCITCCAPAENSESHRDIEGFREMCDIAKSFNTRVALEFLPWAELKISGRRGRWYRRQIAPMGVY
jgi:sugar phosphate isomerase/epimerase